MRQEDEIFGLAHSIKKSRVVLIPAPWEVTTSYGKGTAKGPSAILNASHQVDLFNTYTKDLYKAGIVMLKADKKIVHWNKKASKKAKSGKCKQVNKLSIKFNNNIFSQVSKQIKDGKLVGLVGGDHSVAFGSIRAHTKHYPEMGILQIDAHADLRKSYQGFKHSHASIMHNVITDIFKKKNKLVQIGIRDLCKQEHNIIKRSNKITTFFDYDIAKCILSGKSFLDKTKTMINYLPELVYISFDIDGLDPTLCTNTGTPVPGGLSFNQVSMILRTIHESGRRIVGFDLCEVAPAPDSNNEWDANVGARILYQLICFMLKTQDNGK